MYGIPFSLTSALAFATLGFAVVLHTDFDEVRYLKMVYFKSSHTASL